MLDELVVRLLAIPFALGAVLIFAWTASKRTRFQDSRRDLVVRREAPRLVEIAWTMVFIMVPILFTVPPLFPAIVYANFLSVDFPNSEIVQLIGYALVILGAGLLIYAERTLGRFTIREIGVTKEHELVTRGPYARIRHPLYTATLLMYLGLMLFYLNALPGIVFVLACVGAYGRARVEEQVLSSDEAFGEKYREYHARTGMFLPKLYGPTPDYKSSD